MKSCGGVLYPSACHLRHSSSPFPDLRKRARRRVNVNNERLRLNTSTTDD